MKRLLTRSAACTVWLCVSHTCLAQDVESVPVERGLVQWASGKKGAKPMLIARLPDGRSASVALDKGVWQVDPNPRYQGALIQSYNGSDLFDALNRDREGKCDGPVDTEAVIFAFVVTGKDGTLSIRTVEYRNEHGMPLFGSVWSPEGDHMLVTRYPTRYFYAPTPELLSRLLGGKLAVIETVDNARPDGMRVRWPQVFLGWTDAHRFRFGIGGHDYKYRADYEYDARTGVRTSLGVRGADDAGEPQAQAKGESVTRQQPKRPPASESQGTP